MWSQRLLWRPHYVRIYNPEELTMRKYKFHGEKLEFKEGLAPFRGGFENRIGFVDIHGNIIIKPTYKRIGHLYPGFRDGLCKVSYRKRWGFINKNGEWVIPPIYNDIQSYREGVVAVLHGNKVEYIDTFGKKIFDKNFLTIVVLKFSAIFRRFS